jgi:hypothetical protein
MTKLTLVAQQARKKCVTDSQIAMESCKAADIAASALENPDPSVATYAKDAVYTNAGTTKPTNMQYSTTVNVDPTSEPIKKTIGGYRRSKKSRRGRKTRRSRKASR